MSYGAGEVWTRPTDSSERRHDERRIIATAKDLICTGLPVGEARSLLAKYRQQFGLGVDTEPLEDGREVISNRALRDEHLSRDGRDAFTA